MLEKIALDAISALAGLTRLSVAATVCVYASVLVIVGTVFLVTRVSKEAWARVRRWWWLFAVEAVAATALIGGAQHVSTRPPPLSGDTQVRMTVCGFRGRSGGIAPESGLVGELSLLLDAMGLSKYVEIALDPQDLPGNAREAYVIARRTGSGVVVWGEVASGAGVVYPHVCVVSGRRFVSHGIGQACSVSPSLHEPREGVYTQLALAVIEGALPGFEPESDRSLGGCAEVPATPNGPASVWVGWFRDCPSWAPRPTGGTSGSSVGAKRVAHESTCVLLGQNISGTGFIARCELSATIPDGFVYTPGTLTVNGRRVPDNEQLVTLSPRKVSVGVGTLWFRERVLVAFGGHEASDASEQQP